MVLCLLAMSIGSVQIAQAATTVPAANNAEQYPGPAFTFTDCATQAEIPEAECNALVALYNSTGGASWTNHTNWLQTDTPCSWYGVSCTAGLVTGLNLSSNNLVGSLPAGLGNLTNLTSLLLDGNNLLGEIPASITSLTSLTTLSLSCGLYSSNSTVVTFIDGLLPNWQDDTCPVVASVTRVNASPTSLTSVDFTVTFSEAVTGVTTSAPFSSFALTTTGVTGASITAVTPVSGTVYTVTVATGSGDGTIRLDVVDDDSIQDSQSHPLGGTGAGNGSYTSGAVYSIVHIVISGSAGVAGATLSYTDGSPQTATADGGGNYSFTVSYNWSGTVTPSKAGYTFSPVNKTYSNLVSDQTAQDYTASPVTYTISGSAGVAGATLSYTDGSPKTATADGSGNYSFTVSYNWSGTVTPSKTGYTFSPVNIPYSNVVTNQTAQNYTATPITYTLSGNAGVAGATLSYTDGSPKTATADGGGNYSFTVSYNWSGTVTPSKTGYTFSPVNNVYSNVLADQTGQDYTATPITYIISGNAGIAGVTLSYTDGSPQTATADSNGDYSFTVSYNWSGTVTPSKTGYTFSPVSRTYNFVLSDQTVQNYTATPITYTISGSAGVAGVTLSYTDGTPKTATSDGSGNYSFTVSYNWSGTVTPSKVGYTFSPVNKTYSNVLSNQTAQNYTANPITYTISGNAGVAGATLSYTDGTPKTSTADGSGNYSLTVSYDWSGTVTPSKAGFTFSPVNRTYSNVLSDQTVQNYTATAILYTISGSVGVTGAGATLSYSDGSPKTATADGSGNYSFTVSYSWSGTVTPTKTGYSFSPTSKTYSNVLANQTAQNYTTTPITYAISGNAGVAGVTLSYTDGSPKTATTDSSGNYSFTVSYNWSGTVTPSKTAYTFSPTSRTYSNVLSNQTAQNYTATLIPPPSAEFDAWPTGVNAPSPVTFHIVNTANMTTCSWNYGDGTPAGTSCSPYHDHSYANPGFYTVTFSATGPGGSNNMTRTRYISVYPTLVVNKTGDGSGTVTSNPSGINCFSSCSGNFGYNTSVTLNAVPTPGSSFVGWSGGGCSGTGSCIVNVTIPTTVTARFETIVASCPTITNWKGEYWVNTSLSGSSVVCRDDADLNFNWGAGSPDPLIPVDAFSARWTRTVNFNEGTYRFHVWHDDGARLFIDDLDVPVLDIWNTCCVTDETDAVALSEGNHVLRVEYFENSGGASAELWWERLSPTVQSITAVDADPTGATSVHFNVTFSEPVTGVNTTAPFSDFALTTSGVTGAAITGVSGSGANYTVVVKTGSGSGTIRLDVVDDDSIKNSAVSPLGDVGTGNGNFTNGDLYTIVKVIPGVPTLLSPASGVLLPALQPTLDWKDATPVAHHYQIQIATASNFAPASLVIDETDILGSEFIPAFDLAPGKLYYWRVRSLNLIDGASKWSATRNFKTPLAAPNLLLPSDTQALPTTRPDFDWDDVAGAGSYTIQVSATNTFSGLLLNATASSSEYSPTMDLPSNKLLFWRVQAKSPAVAGPWSGSMSFTSGNPPSIPVLLTPANNALTKDYTPLFDWKDSTLAGGAVSYYELWVDDDLNFSSPVINTTTILSNYTPVSELAHNKVYYWRVRAANTLGGTDHLSAWSVVRSLRTLVDAPALVSPNDGFHALTLRPSFAWDPPSGTATITGYTIQVSKNNTFTQIVHTGNPTVSNYTPTVDLPKGLPLFWRVQTKGANGPSDWSASRGFTSANSPSTPIPSLPAQNSLNTNYLPLFKWSAVTLPATTSFKYYQLQVDDDLNFTNPEINDTSITDRLTVQFQVSSPLAQNTKFYWRVRAVNTADEVSNWSTTRYFRTAVAAPLSLNVTPNGLRPGFDWADATGTGKVTTYTIQLSTIPTFGGLLVNTNTASSAYSMQKNLPSGKTIYWRVRVNGDNGPSAWSTDDFTTP